MLIALSVGILWLHRQSAKIQLEPAIYSFEKLAAALCVDGRRVVCAPAISNRAAAVAIHDRDWTDVCRILSGGLGVSFNKLSADVWEMAQSSDSKLAEKRAFDLWVRDADEHAHSVVARARQILPDWSLPTLRSKSAQLMEGVISSRDGGDSLSAAAGGLLVNLSGSSRLDPLFAWAFFDGDGLGGLVKQDCVAYGTRSSGNRENFPSWALWDFQYRENTNPLSLDRVSLEPVSGLLIATHRFSGGPNAEDSPDFPGPIVADFEWLGTSLAAFKQETWSQVVRTVSPAELEALELAVPNAAQCGSTAEGLVKWAVLAHQDVVMEISSVRDELAINTKKMATFRGKDLLWNEGLGKQNLFDLLYPRHDISEPTPIRSYKKQESLVSLHPWRLSTVDGVLVVANRFSFLDHQFRLPLDHLLELCNGQQGNREDSPVTSLTSLLSYCAKTSLEDNLAVARLDPPLAMPSLGQFYPFGRLLQSLSKVRAADMVDRLDRDGKAMLPMNSFEKQAVRAFGKAMEAYALSIGDGFWRSPRTDSDAMILHPDFQENLRRDVVVVEFVPRSSDSGVLTVKLLPSDPNGLAITKSPLISVQLKEISLRGVSKAGGS